MKLFPISQCRAVTAQRHRVLHFVFVERLWYDPSWAFVIPCHSWLPTTTQRLSTNSTTAHIISMKDRKPPKWMPSTLAIQYAMHAAYAVVSKVLLNVEVCFYTVQAAEPMAHFHDIWNLYTCKANIIINPNHIKCRNCPLKSSPYSYFMSQWRDQKHWQTSKIHLIVLGPQSPIIPPTTTPVFFKWPYNSMWILLQGTK